MADTTRADDDASTEPEPHVSPSSPGVTRSVPSHSSDLESYVTRSVRAPTSSQSTDLEPYPQDAALPSLNSPRTRARAHTRTERVIKNVRRGALGELSLDVDSTRRNPEQPEH